MTLRVACLGAGYFSRFHYDSWRRMEGAEAVAACDRDPVKAKATGLKAFETLDTMLSEITPDILDVILPPDGHSVALKTAIAAGVRTIICQKPFATSLEEATALTCAAEQAGARVIIHENFRFQPWFRAIKRALDTALIGDLHQITFRLRPGDGQGPDAYLNRQPYFQTMPRLLIHETAVHYIDTFRYLVGPPKSVYADLRSMNPVIQGEDAGYVIFEHDSNVRAVFDGNRHLDHAATNLRRTMGEALIEGTAGTLELLGDGSVLHRTFGTQSARQILEPDQSAQFGGDCVHALQKHVVSGVVTGSAIENTAREYLDVIRIKDAIYRSAETGQKMYVSASAAGQEAHG